MPNKTMFSVEEILAAARDLHGQDGSDNPEYQRAQVELICNLLRLPEEAGREIVRAALVVA
jgi:hypothetical protein